MSLLNETSHSNTFFSIKMIHMTLRGHTSSPTDLLSNTRNVHVKTFKTSHLLRATKVMTKERSVFTAAWLLWRREKKKLVPD